jgi:hypothetical protein
MADIRELTERNREGQLLQPLTDFCQGLPYKVRWVGRDPQTGRDLVQYPDGSIVRAGKRIFSGNCPKGTFVEVVDCGVNGTITIDWRDAELHPPLLIEEKVFSSWLVIIDTAFTRFSINNTYRRPEIERQFIKNIKGGDKALGLNYLGERGAADFNDTLMALSDKVYTSFIDMPETLDIEELRQYQQIWILSDEMDSSGPYLQHNQVIVESNAKLFLLTDNDPFIDRANEILRIKYNFEEEMENPISGKFGDDSKEGLFIPSSQVFIKEDDIFDRVPELPGGFTIAAVNIENLPDFKIILETDASYPDFTYPAPFPTIAILREK